LIGEVANCAQIRAPWTTGSVYLANPAEGGKGYGALRVFLLPSGISCRNRIFADIIPGMIRSAIFVILAVLAASAQNNQLKGQVESVFPDAHAWYLDLHQHPELSSHETRTAAALADRLRKLGYEVTENVGGTGVVAIMKNGAGPTVMLRTELDALPVEELTGLPYASKVRAKDDSGRDVGVMHACGHDVHLATLYGAAAIMAKTKDTWHGTL